MAYYYLELMKLIELEIERSKRLEKEKNPVALEAPVASSALHGLFKLQLLIGNRAFGKIKTNMYYIFGGKNFLDSYSENL